MVFTVQNMFDLQQFFVAIILCATNGMCSASCSHLTTLFANTKLSPLRGYKSVAKYVA